MCAEVLYGACVAIDGQARRADGQAADLPGVELPVRVGAVAAQGGLNTRRVRVHGAGQQSVRAGGGRGVEAQHVQQGRGAGRGGASASVRIRCGGR